MGTETSNGEMRMKSFAGIEYIRLVRMNEAYGVLSDEDRLTTVNHKDWGELTKALNERRRMIDEAVEKQKV